MLKGLLVIQEDVDFDFRTLLSLAEQRRGRHDAHDAHDPHAPRAPAPRPARARKVSMMPSPDEHFLSLERERRAEKHDVRAMSPTSPTSELVTCL